MNPTRRSWCAREAREESANALCGKINGSTPVVKIFRIQSDMLLGPLAKLQPYQKVERKQQGI